MCVSMRLMILNLQLSWSNLELELGCTVSALTYAKIDVTFAPAHDQHVGSFVGEGQRPVRLLQHGHRDEELDRIPMTMEGQLSIGHAAQWHLPMRISCIREREEDD